MSLKLFHIICEDEITCLDELQFNGKEYFSCEYNKKRGKMFEIGVKVNAASEVIVKQFNNRVLSLDYDADMDIWYQIKTQWIEKGFKRRSDGIFGFNVGGSFEVEALDETGNLLDSVHVNITPGTMSIEEYKSMQHEVRRLFEIFSYDLTDNKFEENNVLSRVQLPMFPLQTFYLIVQEVAALVNELVERPEVELQTVVKKINVKDVRKWTPSIIIENALKQQEKVVALVSEQVTDIKENKMLKNIIEQFLERTISELIAEKSQLKLFQEEIEELKIMISQENSSVVEKPKQLLIVLNNDCLVLQQRIEQWSSLKVTLDELLELPMLQVESEQLEDTHLFRMHTYYSRIYDLFMQYENLRPELTDTFRMFIQVLLKSPTLYEVWVLLKIIQQLSQWGVNPREFIDDIENKYVKPNTHSISGYRKQFRLMDKPYDIGIYYDFTFNFFEKEYRPDFMIGFYNKSKKKWAFHTLDVKYKNYSAMKNGKKEFNKDLKKSAFRYLTELFPNKDYLHSATLVHLDPLGGHWNVKPNLSEKIITQHKLAHFVFSPINGKNLQIYLKRLLHEGSGYANCCPNCGQEKQGEILNYKVINRNKRSWKTIYKCDECKELWVANFCSDCSFNNRNPLTDYENNIRYNYPRPLFKYPTHNYNVQVGDEWEVHCPTCNCLSYPERPYTFNDDEYKGPNVQYHTKKSNVRYV